MAHIPGFNYDLQELNEWVHTDRASVQAPVTHVPRFSYDLQELNEWGGRMDGNMTPTEDEPLGAVCVLAISVVVVLVGILGVIGWRMLLAVLGL